MTTPGVLPHDWFPRPLPANVRIGERSWLHSAHAFTHCRARRADAVTIGHDTGLYHGTQFDLGPDARVEIGSFCTLVGAILCTNGRIRIGDFSFLAHEVVLADEAWADPGAPAGAPGAAIELGENCWVGMGAVLLAGTRLAEGCVVGAAAVVDFAAPPYAILAGNPARIVGTAR